MIEFTMTTSKKINFSNAVGASSLRTSKAPEVTPPEDTERPAVDL